jgi:phosphohistidine phosphatase SixA
MINKILLLLKYINMHTLLLIIFLLYSNLSFSEIKSINLGHLKKNSSGKIVFLRHAFAPGNGDPSDFKFNDCSTQRNLSKSGVEQAMKIGKIIKNNKVKFNKIYSSYWCRCLDTAKYLDIGNVIPHKGLNSFYENIVDKEETINSFKSLLKKIKPSEYPLLMVTHYVVISEITGLSVSSGEMVVYDIKTKKSKYLKIIE